MNNRIDLGLPNFPSVRQPEKRKQDQAQERSRFLPPPRPQEGYIPPQPLIMEMITRALKALEQGIFWDRGSIVNIVV